MKKISKISIFVLMFSLFLVSTVLAATTPVAPTKISSDSVIIADVNIYNPRVVSQVGNVIKIAFTFSNGEGLQTGIKYGISLVEKTKLSQSLVDEKIYDEVLTLNPNTKLPKEIEYAAPASMNGTYKLVLTAKNSSGFPFTIATVGEVKLTSNFVGIKILGGDCSLQVVGEKSSKVYSLSQGVDIKSEEEIKLTCSSVNSSKDNIIATPSYETRYRSSYGDVVKQIGGDMNEISFKAGEKKTFSVVLPKATEPQAYNVEFTLNNKDIKSNSVNIHYVLRGASATIQNLSLDKDYYKKGDSALVSFIQTPSADSFRGSRFGTTETSKLTTKIEVLDGKSKKCADVVSKIIGDAVSPKVDVSVPITSSCLDPKIIVSITDESGKILEQKEFNVKTTSVVLEKNKSSMYIIIAIIILILIIIVFYIYNKKRKLIQSNSVPVGVVFFFLLLVSLFGLTPTKNVDAANVLQVGTFIGDSVNFVLNIDSDEYNPGDDVNIDATMYMVACGNEPVDASLDVTILEETKNLINEAGYGSDSHPVSAGDTFVVGSNSFSAPALENTYLGEFNVVFNGQTSSANGVDTGTFTITAKVVPPPTVTVTSTPEVVPYGGKADITWNQLNAKSCVCTYDNPSDPDCGSGIEENAGAKDNPYPLTSTTTFTVKCFNAKSAY